MEEIDRLELADPKVSVLMVRNAARQVWAEASEEGTHAHADAKKLGIFSDVLSLPIDDVVELRASGAGIDPSTIDVVVGAVSGALGTGGAMVAKDIWKYVILPNLRARWGEAALRHRG